MRVVALDLSLTGTGIAATHDSNGSPRLACRTVTPRRYPSETAIDHRRLHETIAAVMHAVGYRPTGFAWKPDLVVVEWLPQYDGKGDISLRTAELHGPVKHWLWDKGIRYVDIRPTHLKMYATGNGGAKKHQVREHVTARYGSLLHIGSEDEADAVALLSMTLDAYGQPLERNGQPIVVPDTHRRAIQAYQWPTLAAKAVA